MRKSLCVLVLLGLLLLPFLVGSCNRPEPQAAPDAPTMHGEASTAVLAGGPAGGGGSPVAAPAPVGRSDGAAQLLSLPSPFSAQNPAYSPDGGFLLYTRFHTGYNAGPAGLYRLPAAGGVSTTLLYQAGHDSVNVPGSAWTAATNLIAFASDREGKDEIWTMAAGGGGLKRVTRHPEQSRYIEPSFSPDGRWLVFEVDSLTSGQQTKGAIYKVRTDGTGLIRLSPPSSLGYDDRLPNWSPKGDRIVFQRRFPGTDDWNLYTIKPDGTGLHQVTKATSSDTDPSWSTDGRWIVYSSDYGDLPHPNIFAVSAGGGTPTRVTRSSTHEDAAPSWSPDGRWIAFESHTAEDAPASLWRIVSPIAATPTQPFTWPEWARRARIAGWFFELGDTDAEIDHALDALAAQQVSVLLADSPWGWSYSAWVDDVPFAAVKRLVTKVVQKAHARGLKVVLYQTGLELISSPSRNPGPEHPDWPQRSLAGKPILFNDISGTQEHWLEKGEWDLWLSPSGSYRAFALARTRQVVATGVDGLWVDTVYLQHSIGAHDDLWPSTDATSAAAFRLESGLSVPAAENWDSLAWRRWVVWRHAQMTDFLLDLKAAARAVNPKIVFFEENWCADTAASTHYANDPADYQPQLDIATGHEISSIADRVDEGETGMMKASLEQWLAFRTQVAFARAADRGKPSWILTYGYRPRDSAQLAGMTLAEGANFYETQGPAMDGTVGSPFRARLFGWIKAHEAEIYGSDAFPAASLADVALVYSPRTRDLLDGGSGSYYDVEDSIHFAAYRCAARLLYRNHVLFDVVLDTDLTAFPRYKVLILPEVQAMSEATTSALRAFPGKILAIGQTGSSDQWLRNRVVNALSGTKAQFIPAVSADLLPSVSTGLLSTTAAPSVQMGLRRNAGGYSLVLVNIAGSPTAAFRLSLQLRGGTTVASVKLSSPGASERSLAFTVSGDRLQVDVPAGIDTLALLRAQTSTS